ncbi:hypothetical protein AGOR_G00066400 [Albula goreensis]|uniref:Uncharacterized protein n=1 Tax=Albula goreensis TaxID=1534307 RepID=A0A8T3DYZ0_9TELE|nr:hypothetical protein AGOR_G00066400 [Albula goreensis]
MALRARRGSLEFQVWMIGDPLVSLDLRERREKQASPTRILDYQGHQGSKALKETQVTKAIQVPRISGTPWSNRNAREPGGDRGPRLARTEWIPRCPRAPRGNWSTLTIWRQRGEGYCWNFWAAGPQRGPGGSGTARPHGTTWGIWEERY